VKVERVLIDFLGALLGIAATMVLYEALWDIKKVNRYIIAAGIFIIALVNVSLTHLLINTMLLPLISVANFFALSYFYISGIKAKIFFPLIALAILFIAELLAATALINTLGFPIEQVQENSFIYFIGVVTSNLLALFIAFIVRAVMRGYKKDTINQFNLITVLMPIQSIIICFVVSFYSINDVGVQVSPLGIVSILVSLSLVFVALFIVKKLQQSIIYKGEFEVAQERLKNQIEQYEKLNQAQNEIRAVRHDLSNTLIAISGFLKDGHVEDALKHISSISSSVDRTAAITNTGVPALDAIVGAKIDKAEKSGVRIISKINIDCSLNIDSFDLAGIVANALDNAIEGILRSNDGIERDISLTISTLSDFISIFIENHSSGSVRDDFRTSKPDMANHGFGIKQIKTVAKKYNGDVRIKYDSESLKFSLKILLQNTKI